MRGLTIALLMAASCLEVVAATRQDAPPEPENASQDAPAVTAAAEEGAAAGNDAPGALEEEGADPDAAPAPPPDVLEVADGLYVLPYCGNATARVTPHGVVLVGDTLAQHRDEIARLLATVTDQRIEYELHTHRHGEDADSAPIAPGARRLAPARLGAAPAGERATRSGVVFHERISIFLGDVEVRMHHLGRGHSDGDAVVVFPDRGAVHTGHLVVGGAPALDPENGGNGAGWTEALHALLALEFDTAIPGDGPVLQKSDVQVFRDRFVTLRTRLMQLVRRGVAQEDVASHLQTTDLEWPLDPIGDFVRQSLPALYEEIASGP